MRRCGEGRGKDGSGDGGGGGGGTRSDGWRREARRLVLSFGSFRYGISTAIDTGSVTFYHISRDLS